MREYQQLSLRERFKIKKMLNEHHPIAQIAKSIGRHRSTVYRELSRNVKPREDYESYRVYELFRKRKKKKKKRKIDKRRDLKNYVKKGLEKSWSPEQIVGRMKREEKDFSISVESIYAYLFDDRNKKWLELFHKSRKKKRLHRRRRKVRSKKVPPYKLITQRPPEVVLREEFGHWEGDLMCYKKSGSEGNLTTLVERKTRFLVMFKNECRKSKHVMENIKKTLSFFPIKSLKTLSVDQGSEFMFWDIVQSLTKRKSLKVFYCHPRSPWEKGTNENTNGRIRQFLPRTMSINTIGEEEIDKVCTKINNTPRKVLGFKTPKEAFLKEFSRNCRT